jgi:alpha-tubulin suppressor-like RCC1 family protein
LAWSESIPDSINRKNEMKLSIYPFFGLLMLNLATAKDPPYLLVKQVATGDDHACALLTTGDVKCWGSAIGGQLGRWRFNDIGDEAGEMGNALPIVNLGAPGQVTQIALGFLHSCALLTSGALKCWGANDAGQLGLGHTRSIGGEPGEMDHALPPVNVAPGLRVVEVTAGYAHTCARLEDGSVKCWGRNDVGQLGLGNTATRGDQAFEMGNFLPNVDLGSGHTAVRISAGPHHTCALLDDGTVKCWGGNSSGELGRGHARNIGDEPFEMGNFLQTADLDYSHAVVAIGAGGHSSCALFDDGAVRCWGANQYGQLGLGDTISRGDNAGEMGAALPSISLGLALEPASRLTVGNSHACALLGATVRCWGFNVTGQLGLGDRDNRGDDPGELGTNIDIADLASNATPTHISAGAFFTCARFSSGRIKCWGLNSFGQLGIGNRSPRGDGDGELGDALPYVDLGTAPVIP